MDKAHLYTYFDVLLILYEISKKSKPINRFALWKQTNNVHPQISRQYFDKIFNNLKNEEIIIKYDKILINNNNVQRYTIQKKQLQKHILTHPHTKRYFIFLQPFFLAPDNTAYNLSTEWNMKKDLGYKNI